MTFPSSASWVEHCEFMACGGIAEWVVFWYLARVVSLFVDAGIFIGQSVLGLISPWLRSTTVEYLGQGTATGFCEYLLALYPVCFGDF